MMKGVNDMKKALKTEITKEKILKASEEEFALYGFDGATINQICQKHGISKGLIYHNFRSKEELFLCCVETAVNSFISNMKNCECVTDFKLYLKERYAFFEAHPNYSRLIFAVVLTDNEDFSDKLSNIKTRFDDFNKNIYMSLIENIRLRDGVSADDALDYYSLLQDMLNSSLLLEKSPDNFDNTFSNHEKRLEKILDIILYGIAEQED